MSTDQFSAIYFDGFVPIGREAAVTIDDESVTFSAGEYQETHPRGEVLASPRSGLADRFVTLPSGGQLQCHDHPALDRLPQESAEGFVVWLEQRSFAPAGAYVLSLAALASLYFWALPAVADVVAFRIDPDSELVLGQRSYDWLDANHVLNDTTLELHKREAVAAGFERLVAPLPRGSYYRLYLRNAPGIGPNAFAFPGGVVLVTDQLLEVCNPEETIAILAHEVGHLEERHALRQVFRASASTAFAGLVSSDISSVTQAGMTLPVTLTQLRYSREFELEADDYAFRRLKQLGVSPELFASCLGRLEEYWSKKLGDDTWSFTSTHPSGEERIAYARAAAASP